MKLRNESSTTSGSSFKNNLISSQEVFENKIKSRSERISSKKYLNQEVEVRQDPSIDDYSMGKILGRGAYGVVNLATHKSSGDTVAVKTVRMS